MIAWSGGRRAVVQAVCGLVASAMLEPALAGARRRHTKQRKRRDKHCKSGHKTCDRGCDVLDDDSQHFCKQSCKVALSQCKSNC